MSSSGTYLFDPTLAQLADEAFERAGIRPHAITADHIISFRRSVGYAFSRWSNKGMRQWKFGQLLHTTAVAETSFDLPDGTIDVQTIVLRRNSVDTELVPMSRADYLILADKNIQGRANSYFVNRRKGTPGDSVPPQVFYWQAGENITDVIVVDYYLQIQDPGTAQATLDIPFRFQEAVASDLAARMAQKFKPENYDRLQAYAEQMFEEADDEDTESAPLMISARYGMRGRRR